MKMKRVLFILAILVAVPLHEAAAKVYKVKDVPMVHLVDRTRYVSNPDNILSSGIVAEMDRMLYALEEQTGIQVLVVALTDIEGDDCFDFAYRLGQENGVGEKGRDNGLVILLSTGERCIEFVTGYGLEGVMPDALCKRVQLEYMNGHFANDDWDTGMLEGIRAVCGVLDGSMENISADEDGENLAALALFLGILVVGVAIIFLAVWYSNRCPNCRKHKIQRVDSHIVQHCNGYVVRENTYRCLSCGHIFSRREQGDDNSSHRPRGGGMIIGGFGGRGFGGGGLSGGSFGGGSFGGGGAGSRF